MNDFNLNYVQIFSSYLTENRVSINFRDQLINVDCENKEYIITLGGKMQCFLLLRCMGHIVASRL
jgi:hypothetical protein